MRDLIFVAFLAGFMGLGFKRPFLFTLSYIYIDLVSPQRLSYYLLNSIPVSALAFALAVLGWLIVDDKQAARPTWRQGLMLALLVYCGLTTLHADFPESAITKWEWVWKAMVFGLFLPLTLTTRLRIEATALTIVLCVSSIVITGGIKTALSGGGYGTLNLMISDNSGLYEGSIISTVAIALIPIILYLAKWGSIYPSDWRVKVFAGALCFACLLIPIGTEARTGLVCAAFLVGLFLMHARRKFLYGGLIAFAAVLALPFLPSSFTKRMDTINNYQADESASTRVAVWKWTWDYVRENPIGGGFDSYLGNSLRYEAKELVGSGTSQRLATTTVVDKGRAFHSSYFEMLGEQGFFGLIAWLTLNFGTVARAEWLRRRYARRTEPEIQWAAPLILALQQGHLVYLLGSLFVGIAYQPFLLQLLALQIGLDSYLKRREKAEQWAPLAPARTATA